MKKGPNGPFCYLIVITRYIASFIKYPPVAGAGCIPSEANHECVEPYA